MTKCDVALGSDAEAMVSGNAASGCPAIDCIIHAGGVLQVFLHLEVQIRYSDGESKKGRNYAATTCNLSAGARCLSAGTAQNLKFKSCLVPYQSRSCVAQV
jgi:hypothetical protein